MSKLNKFQMVGFTHWKGLTKNNHLGAAFALAPQKATNLMVQLMAYHRGKNLESMLSQFPVREFETDDEYTWEVIASSRRNIPLVEVRGADGTPLAENAYAGENGDPFYLVFAEDWFADGEVIEGPYNDLYPIRVLGDAIMEGTNAVYKCEAWGSVDSKGIPVGGNLETGCLFSVGAAFVEQELSRKVGDVRFSTPVSMRNEFSRVRIQHKVPGSMLNKKLAVGIPVVAEQSNGKLATTVKNMWMHVVEWEAETQFADYKNWALAFGRSNRNANGEYKNIGKSGNVIKAGDGLFAQMEVANTHYYTTFNIALLENILLELSTAKLGLGERYFVIKTGERGAAAFHKAVLQEVAGWTQFKVEGADVLGKTSSNLHGNALKAGFQFVEYMAPNGVRVKIEVEPFYDDPIRNKIQHPLGGPAMSYRYDIMDMGTADQANIFKCAVKGQSEYRGYQFGFRNPYTGQMNNTNMSFDEDSAVMHRMATLGICVLDPTRTMSLIPAILAD